MTFSLIFKYTSSQIKTLMGLLSFLTKPGEAYS